MATDPEFEFTALDAIRQSGIVIASDGAEYLSTVLPFCFCHIKINSLAHPRN